MEEWQRQVITRNKSALITLTECNPMLFSELESLKILSKVDSQLLKAQGLLHGQIAQSLAFYDLVTSRVGAYEALIEVLQSELLNQNGAAKILKEARDQHHAQVQEEPAQMQIECLSTSITNPSSSISLIASSSQIRHPNKISTARILSSNEEVDYEAEYMNLVENNETLQLVVNPPTQNMLQAFGNKDYYKLPFNKSKGLALLVNIKEFNTCNFNGENEPDLTRNGSEMDVQYLRTLWKSLGYEICLEKEIDRQNERWYKRELKDLIQKFKTVCDEVMPESIVVFIGSHGGLNKIYTSDRTVQLEQGAVEFTLESVQLLEDIVQEFYHEKCPSLVGKPKLFLISACQNFNVEKDGLSSLTLQPGVSDTIVCTAQVPGFSAYRSPVTGTWFIHCLTFVMMKYAREKSLQEMLRIVSAWMKRLKKEKFPDLDHGQIPAILNLGLEELYYFMPTN